MNYCDDAFEICDAACFPLDESLAHAFSDLTPEERFLRIRTVSSQPAPQGLFTASRDGKLVGAVYSQLRPDKTLLLWPPGTEIDDETLRGALYDRVKRYADQVGAGVMIAFSETRPRKEFEQAGFEYASEMLTLLADEISFPMQWKSDRLSFAIRSAEFAFEEMAPLFERTFEKTRDFPKFLGIVPIESVLRAYSYQPQTWFFVQVEGENAGCLILTDTPEFDQMELTYMGLVPEFRGRKLSLPIVQFALWTARMKGRRMVTVSVDAQNDAAVRAYTRCGFRPWSRKSLYLQRLP